MSFIVIEGVDGCGKTTVSKLLQQKLQKVMKEKIYWCRAPDGPIRDVLLNRPLGTVIDDWTELLLFVAAHRWLLINKVFPALDRGCVVVLDRYTDTTIAYQGGGRNLGVAVVERMIYQNIFEHYGHKSVPDFTLYIQADKEVRETRIAARGHLDHMDLQGEEFRGRIVSTMKELQIDRELRYAKGLSQMCIAEIENSGSMEELEASIDQFIKDHLFLIWQGVLKQSNQFSVDENNERKSD